MPATAPRRAAVEPAEGGLDGRRRRPAMPPHPRSAGHRGEDAARGRSVTKRGGDDPRGLSQRARRRPAQPGEPQVIARQQRSAAAGVAARGGMMVRGGAGDVGQGPPGAGQIHGHERFLGAEEESGLEAPDLEKRGAAHHAGAGEEAHHARAGQLRVARQRTRRHLRARRVLTLVGPDEDASGHHGQPRMAIEQVGGQAERSRGPPRVVIRQRHVRRARTRDADVAARGAEVLREPHDVDAGKASAELGGRAVARRVVERPRSADARAAPARAPPSGSPRRGARA